MTAKVRTVRALLGTIFCYPIFNFADTLCLDPFLKPRKDGRKSENQAEFAAYSIIYCLYTKNMTDMTKRLSQLSEDMAKDSLISDALKLRSHLSLGNYLVSLTV